MLVIVTGTVSAVNQPFTRLPDGITLSWASFTAAVGTKFDALLLLVEQLPLTSHAWMKNST